MLCKTICLIKTIDNSLLLKFKSEMYYIPGMKDTCLVLKKMFIVEKGIPIAIKFKIFK